MLSEEARPVETIATDERGCPRWVMCHWTDAPQEMLLLLYWAERRGGHLCYRPGDAHPVNVDPTILHEMPTDEQT